jgi:hypothetical protein
VAPGNWHHPGRDGPSGQKSTSAEADCAEIEAAASTEPVDKAATAIAIDGWEIEPDLKFAIRFERDRGNGRNSIPCRCR